MKSDHREESLPSWRALLTEFAITLVVLTWTLMISPFRMGRQPRQVAVSGSSRAAPR